MFKANNSITKMQINIHDRPYMVKVNEFREINDPSLYPLKVREDVGKLDREIAFLKEVGKDTQLYEIGSRYGYYVRHNLTNCFTKICLREPTDSYGNTVLRVERGYEADPSDYKEYAYIITDHNTDISSFTKYSFIDRYVYVHSSKIGWFKDYFAYCIDGDVLQYDNLVNLLIMVKNAGDGFRDILKRNLPYIDRFTILDTGSTDNTLQIINEVMFASGKPGELYNEPFINFRDSRNRLLDLAGEKCAFNVMLDDSYVLHGNLREFLTMVRGDDVASTYSIFIKDLSLSHGSIRITKPEKKKRYKYIIHEIIDDIGHQIPQNIAYIEDVITEYMSDRTLARKQRDLEMLFEEIKNDPTDPRNYYYVAETYLCMQDWKSAIEWYEKCFKMNGYIEERQDALYKIAVINHFSMGSPWKDCHELYLNAHRFAPNRPEAMFVIGYHYVEEDYCPELAHMYLKKAFEIGIPTREVNMNLKIKMYYQDIPQYLLNICYSLNDWELGLKAVERLMKYVPDSPGINMWHSIFYLLVEDNKYERKMEIYDERKLIAFVAPGGWEQWSGKSLYEKGLGGAETCIVKFAETINKNYSDKYRVIVFCDCGENIEHNGVTYISIRHYVEFINKYRVDLAFIHRYPEYVGVTVENDIPCKLFLHDLVRPYEVMTNINDIEIISLSESHKQNILAYFPNIQDRISITSYGIDVNEFQNIQKKPYSFIYSSFPNRGLYNLLKIWPRILKEFPQATLNVFCDLQNEWVQRTAKAEIDEIEKMLIEHKETVTNHGWVNKRVLYDYWCKSQFWLYPSNFIETFCLTAYEAAASKTAVITTDRGSLPEVVDSDGIIIPGDPTSKEWEDKAIQAIHTHLQTNNFVVSNYEKVVNKSYDNVVKEFVEKFIN